VFRSISYIALGSGTGANSPESAIKCSQDCRGRESDGPLHRCALVAVSGELNLKKTLVKEEKIPAPHNICSRSCGSNHSALTGCALQVRHNLPALCFWQMSKRRHPPNWATS